MKDLMKVMEEEDDYGQEEVVEIKKTSKPPQVPTPKDAPKR